MRIGLALLLLGSLVVQDSPRPPHASGGVLSPEQAAFDVQHYTLTLKVSPETRSIEGKLAMKARVTRALSVIVLDLDPRLKVRGVTSGGARLEFQHSGGQIRISLDKEAGAGDEVEVTVAYGGKPRVAPRPPWDGGFTWKKSKDGRPWIATTCQSYGADVWWPCKDHPSDKPKTMDLHITIPENLFCASNGTLKSDEKNGDGTRTLHWHISNPISNYNVALNIGPYKVIKSSWKSVGGERVPVFFWVLPESVKKAKKILPQFIEHMKFHESVCGPYPFRNEKYGIVETPHLGMEHQSIVAYGNGFKGLQQGYDWLHHHESAHEWWANLVTCSDWRDMWIHEGFGTYMQALYLERKRGKAAYHKEMANNRRQIKNQKTVAPREATDSVEIFEGHDVYTKGSWILHTLRWELGDKTFFKTIRRFAYPTPESEKVTDGSQVRLVDTDDFLATVEKHSGREMDWFFEVYLRQPHLPRLVTEQKGGRLHLRWETPENLPFPMAVPIRIGRKTHRIEMKDGKASIRVPRGAQVAVDPENWILKR